MSVAERSEDMEGAATPVVDAAEGVGEAGAPGREEVLDLDEVLELQSFATKKAWIDDKIAFLSTLDSIDALAPLPPLKKGVTQEQLDGWWAEHEQLENDVESYDMGDLAKLKAFAKDASQRTLSPNDTDLIEITLSTLLSIDTLLHLLRQRRKALNLLSHRLQWEQHVSKAWDEHHGLLKNLNKFVSRARWTAEASGSSGDDLASSTSSMTDSPLRRSVPGSARKSQNTLSLRASKPDMLALEIAQQKHKVQAFCQTTLPRTNETLDLLIDTATLPDEFLDEQERLETESEGLAADMVGFIVLLAGQWKAAEDVANKAAQIEVNAAALQAEVEAAVAGLHSSLSLPSAESTQYRSRMAALEQAAEVLAGVLPSPTSAGTLPMPSHGRVVDQQEANEKLVADLRALVDGAESCLDPLRAALAAFEKSLAAATAAKALLERTREASKAYLECEELFKKAAGFPSLNIDTCLVPTPQEASYRTRFNTTKARLDAIDCVSLLKDVYEGSIPLLSQLGFPTNKGHGKELKDAAEQVAEQRTRSQAALVDRERKHALLDAARGYDEQVRQAQEEIAGSRTRLCDEVSRFLWLPKEERPPTPVQEGIDPNALVAAAKSRLTTLQLDKLSSASPEHADLSNIKTNHPMLFSSLVAKQGELTTTSNALLPLARLLTNVKAQTVAANALMSDLDTVGDALAAASTRLEDELSRAQSPTSRGQLQAELREIGATVATNESVLVRLVAEAHKRVPFVSRAGQSSTLRSAIPALPLVDDRIRKAINESSARLSGLVADLKSRINQLDELRLGFAWDEEVKLVEQELSGVVTKLSAVKTKMDEPDGRSEDATGVLQGELAGLVAQRESFSYLLTSLATSLDSLQRMTRSKSQDDDPHAPRVQTYEAIQRRYTEMGLEIKGLQDHVSSKGELLRRRQEEARRQRELEEAERARAEEAYRASRGELQAELEGLSSATSVLAESSVTELAALNALESLCSDTIDFTRTPSFDLSSLDEHAAKLNQLESRHADLAAHLSSIDTKLEALGEAPSEELASPDVASLRERISEDLDRARNALDDAAARLVAAREDRVRWQALYDANLAQLAAQKAEEEARAAALAEEERRRKVAEETERLRVAAELRAEDERLAQLERERAERERLEHETLEKIRLERERLEQERLAADELERQRAADEEERRVAEELAQARLKAEQLQQERAVAEAAVAERVKAEEEERVRKLQEEARQAAAEAEDRELVDEEDEDTNTPPEEELVSHLEEGVGAAKVDTSAALLADLLASLAAAVPVIYLEGTEVNTLPSVADSAVVSRDFSLVSARVEDTQSDGVLHSFDLERLQQAVEDKGKAVERVAQLSLFTDAVKVAEESLSGLLNSIDAVAEGITEEEEDTPPASLPDALLASTTAVTSMRTSAVECIDDERVASETARIDQVFEEMSAMADDVLRGKAESSRASSRASQTSRASSRASQASSTSSIPRYRGSKSPPAESLVAAKVPASRIVSSGTSRLPKSAAMTATRSLGHGRSVSSGIPRSFAPSEGRQRFPSAAPSLPLSSTRSISSATSSSRASSHSSGIISMARRTSIKTAPPRTRMSSERLVKDPTRTPPKPTPRPVYRPNMKRQVDVEVGRIVNQLKVVVPIRAAADGMQDKSGKYWIGDVDPRLYFCRILRSQTVMVRIGGGWQELGAFLHQHFGRAAAVGEGGGVGGSPTQTLVRSVSGSSWEGGKPWISAASVLSKSASSFGPSSPRDRLPSLPSLSPTQSFGSLASLVTSTAREGEGEQTPTRRTSQTFQLQTSPSPENLARFLKRADQNQATPKVKPGAGLVWRP